MRGNPGVRHGFTLIELLVVIGIVAILMALVGAAVMGVMGRGPEMVTQNDINQMTVSAARFASDFGDKPFPSLLYLSNDRNDYTRSGPGWPYDDLRRDSLAYLSKMFPRMDWTQVNWNVPKDGVLLEGDQCLVFFLGGPDGNGFSANAANPTDGATQRKGPYFNFPAARLKAMPAASILGISRSQSAKSFIDGFGKQPYLYFSSGRRKNGYNAYVAAPTSYGSDCRSFGVSPYYSSTSPTSYYNKDTFQIISAGADTEFGPGKLYDGASPDLGLLTKAGMDDLTNFHGSRLEVPE